MNISGADLNLLMVFHSLMTERSVTRAAAKVGLSQPALSNALKRLRDLFGDKLFVKGRKAMVPTPRALELAPDVDAAIACVRTIFQQPEFRPESTKRVFRLATTDEIEMLLLPALVKRLNRVAPGISMNCSRLPGIFKLPQSDLQSGALDFAIGAFPQPQALAPDLFSRGLYETSIVCIARKGHPVVKRGLSLSQFCKLAHVATFYPGEGPGLIDRILAEQGHKRNVNLSLPHWLPLPFVVVKSDLIATVPELFGRAVTRFLPLLCLKCPISIPPLQVSLAWHARTHESASHRWFRNLIVDISAELTKDTVTKPARGSSASQLRKRKKEVGKM
jgi:DNA-binding transcriptional LysR family regulator